jgi:hypothetical protein
MRRLEAGALAAATRVRRGAGSETPEGFVDGGGGC